MGKTSLALQIAKNIGVKIFHFFGFDMSKEEYVYRILGMNLVLKLTIKVWKAS